MARVAHGHRMGWDILGHHGACTDHHIIADGNARTDHHAAAEPHVIADGDRTGAFPDRKRVRPHRLDGMAVQADARAEERHGRRW